jgi:hypothetical protein
LAVQAVCLAGKYSEFVNLDLKIECGVDLPDGNSIAYQQNSLHRETGKDVGANRDRSFAKQ